ncbi:hypothetical protein D3C72_1873730 [compost metagenome]
MFSISTALLSTNGASAAFSDRLRAWRRGLAAGRCGQCSVWRRSNAISSGSCARWVKPCGVKKPRSPSTSELTSTTSPMASPACGYMPAMPARISSDGRRSWITFSVA